MTLRKILMLLTTILLSLLLFEAAWATTWYLNDNSEGTPGSSMPNSYSGPYWFEYNPPGVFANTTPRNGGGSYAQLTTANNQNAYLVEITNPRGAWGTAFSEASPILLTQGTTYYLAGFFRFDRIAGNNIWTDGNPVYDFDKLIEMQGSGFRWGVGVGGVYSYNQTGKFTFDSWCASSAFSGCETDGEDHKRPNKNGYSRNNPYPANYEGWYAVVLGVEYRAYPALGRVRLWVNGTLVTDQTSCSTGNTGARIVRIYLNGTIGQPGYNAPAHKRLFDGIILTDSYDTLLYGGYLQNPGGSSPPPTPPTPPPADGDAPAAPTGLIIRPGQ